MTGTSKTADQVVVGDVIVDGQTVYTVDKVGTDDGVQIGRRGYVNLELLHTVGGVTRRTYQRHPWYQVVQVEPWLVYSHAQAEQPPFSSHLAAARWAEDHDEDLNRYDDEDET